MCECEGMRSLCVRSEGVCLNPIATFSLYRQWACGRQHAILWHRLVKRHRYTDHEY